MYQRLALALIFIENLRDGSAGSSVLSGQCRDFNGRIYEHGMHYMPGPDICRLCVCDNGQSKGCKVVLCHPPSDCKSFQVGNNCCEYRKIRVRENRQNNDDQRSIASIGYIGGNIGYMGGNSIGIEYPYEGNTSHYQLWKPPNGYFPRGEAPPPYEEAVALAQSEALSAQCTVSFATTTHRSLPVNINPSETSGQESQSSITTSTTNLINININSTGNLTTLATTENHQSPYRYESSSLNQPRSTQTHSNCSSSSSSSIGEPSNTIARVQTSAVCVQSTPVVAIQNPTCTQSLIQGSPSPKSNQTIECTYKNCTLGAKYINNKTYKTMDMLNQCKTNNCGNSSLPSERADVAIESQNQSAILPPPLFDEGERRDTQMNNEIMKTPSSSRRYHRTIPRHFTAVDPLLVNVKNSESNISQQGNKQSVQSSSTNKKPTCQCPIQHVPMTYMGSNHFNTGHNTNSVFLTTLTTKLVSNKSNNPVKPIPVSTSGKLQINSKIGIDNQNALRVEQQNANNTLKRSSGNHSATNFNHNSGGGKIATISKQVGDLKHDESGNQCQIQSILKVPSNKEKSFHGLCHSNQNSMKTNTGIPNSPFSIHFIDGISKIPINSIENPVLPPKLYKNQGLKQAANPLFVSKIHTISMPSETQPVPPRTSSIPRAGNVHQISTNSQIKSLPRKEDKLAPTFTLPPSGLLNTERSQSLGKINSTTFYPIQNNHATYTLPKQSNGKMSLNSTIASVVSKVPSVINIPPPSLSTLENYSGKINDCSISPDNTQYPNRLNNNSNNTKLLSPTENQKPTTLPKVKKHSVKPEDKPLPVCTTSKNCSNPKEHFLPNDTSLDDDYLSECENCKTAHSSRYYLEEEIEEAPQETMTLQRKMDDKEEEQAYYRTSLTLPTNTKKNTIIKNNRETWFSSIPASSSSDEEPNE